MRYHRNAILFLLTLFGSIGAGTCFGQVSYIVAFKVEPNQPDISMGELYRQAQGKYLDRIERMTGVSFTDLISQVDLSLGAQTSPLSYQPLMGEFRDESKPIHLVRVDFSDLQTARRRIAQWLRSGMIAYAEPNGQNQLMQADPKAGMGAYVSSYEGFALAPHSQIQLVDAYKEMTDVDTANTAPVIAILDSGIDYGHPQLKNRMFENSAAGSTDCGNDTYGCNTSISIKGALGTPDVNPVGTQGPGESCPSSAGEIFQGQCEHGTHVAGLVAAEPGTGYGGVCPICKVLAVRIVGLKAGTNAEVSIPDSAILDGMSYVNRFNLDGKPLIRIVNSSFGKYQRSRSVNLMVRLLRSRGILVIGAAGNEGSMKRSYPAAFSDAVAVANLYADGSGDDQPAGSKNPTSNYGPWVDIAAPGSSRSNPSSGILSTVPGGSTGYKGGTSMACPMTAGVAGLILAKNPGATFDALREALLGGAVPTIYDIPKNASFYPTIPGEARPIAMLGRGLLNAKNAITLTRPDGQPSEAANIRVTENCGAIGGGKVQILQWWMLLPLILVGWFNRMMLRRQP